MRMKLVIFVAFLTFVAGCTKDTPVGPGESFLITVLGDDGRPVEGATIEGGIDWDAYQVQTDAAGRATLPGSARGKWAVMYKTNYLPVSLSSIGAGKYSLKRTEKKFVPIGTVAGKAVRFRPGELITLDYGGTYHLYTYSDQAVSEIYSRRLHDSASAIRQTQLHGDTLWFTTHDAGLYVFSIRNPSSPVLLFRIAVPGYLGPFAVKDSLVVIGSMWDPGPLRTLSFRPDGSFREVSSVQNYFVRQMTRLGDAVILIGNSESLPTVFDISRPDAPRLLYNGLEWEYQTGFFYDQLAILTPRNAFGGNAPRLEYKVLDLSNPGSPLRLPSFSADARITELASPTLAVGAYYAHSQTITVLSGSLTTSFQTVATVSEGTIDGAGGSFPPYFVIGDRLWKLVDR